MRDVPLDPLWERVDPVPAELALGLGLPQATRIYRRLASDGQLWAALGHDAHGALLTVTHTVDSSVERLVPGRMPTLMELYEARVALIEEYPLMVCLLEPIEHRLLKRWGARELHHTVGLPTTLLAVETGVEDVTDDLVTQAPADAPLVVPATGIFPPDEEEDDEDANPFV
jgi:hypothetical protein